MKRNKHSLSHYKLATFDMGELVPVANLEVLPGDSIRMSTSCLLRVSPLMTPVMHPVVVRLHHWFVPYRLLWDEWEDFITGGPDGSGASTAFPTFTTNGTWNGVGTLADYLGVPPIGGLSISKFPILAYVKIWNEFYRDQDLQSPIDPDDVGFVAATQRIAWEKDQFTAARPWTQKGPDVTLPIAGSAPVLGIGWAVSPGNQGTVGPGFKQSDGSTTTRTVFNPPTSVNFGSRDVGGGEIYPDIHADLTQATSSTVNDVRLAFALQRYQEARAQFGSRYTEYLRYLGVRSSDARLDRPEYLGGGRSTISFSEVLRTGDDSATADPEAPIGELRGHGISAMRSRSFVRFFEEHGVVLSLVSIRPRTMYMDGLHKSWSRRTKEDYWQKELEQIGQEEVAMQEIYAGAASPLAPFGWNDRYYSYRHHPSTVSGDFRTTLNDWHLSRSFAAAPALNPSFIECVPSKRIHAVQTEDVIWGMFSHSIQARRLVGNKTIGRIF